MDNFKIAVTGVLKRAADAFGTYPAAMANAFLFAIVAIVRINLDWEVQQEYNFFINSMHWALALGAVFSFAAITGANSRYNTRSASIKANLVGVAVAGLTFALLFFFGESSLDGEFRYLSEIARTRVSVGIWVSMVAFVYLASLPRDRSTFAKAFMMTHKAILIAALYGLVLMVGVSGVAGAIQSLLYNDMSNKVFQYIGVIAGFMTFSIFIGYFPDFRKGVEDPRRLELQEQPKFIQVLLGYILVPILLALTLVLLLWSIRTILSGVESSFVRLSGIAASYALGGIWLHIMVTDHETGLARFFKKVYPFTALIILAFEAWALVVQLNKTGLKTIEYNFIAVWIFTVVSVVMLILLEEESHRKIAIIASLISAIVVLPFIGFHTLPVTYQVNRLERILLEQGMLQNGTIIPSESEPDREIKENITDSVNFLAYRENKNIPVWLGEELYNDKEFEETFGFEKTWPEVEGEIPREYLTTNLVLESGVVDIKEYTWAINFKDYYGSEEVKTQLDGIQGTYEISWVSAKGGIPEMSVKLDGEMILQADLEGFFDGIVESYPPGERSAREAGFEEMSLVVESDELKVLIVFENIEIGFDTTNNRTNQWFIVSGMYVKEK